nr:hypothetical protein [bacterium]
LQMHVKNGEIKHVIHDALPDKDQSQSRVPDDNVYKDAHFIWMDISPEIPTILEKYSLSVNEHIVKMLENRAQDALNTEKERYRQRIQEVERAMRENTLKKLEKERDDLVRDMKQGALFPEFIREKEEKLRNLDDELRRRRSHYIDLIEHLKNEEKRVIKHVLPKRFSLKGSVQIFPVAVEIRLSEEQR